MISIKFCWILLIFSSHSFAIEDYYDQLMGFSGEAATPHPKMQDNWQLFEDLEQDNYQKQEAREPRNVESPQSKLKAFKDDKKDLELKKAADAWYRNLIKSRNNQKRSSISKPKDIFAIDKVGDRSDMAMEWNSDAAIQKTDYNRESILQPKVYESEIPDVDMKIKHLNEILNEKDSLEKTRAEIAKHFSPKKDKELTDDLSDFGKAHMPDGIYERTLYSIGNSIKQYSKIPEQTEFKYPKPSSSSTLGKTAKLNKLNRRSMDPMKLMDKDYGPRLPSSALEANQKSIDVLDDFSLGNQASNNVQNTDLQHKTFNEGQVIDLPNSYDAEMTNYNPLPSIYQDDMGFSTYLDDTKEQPGLESSSSSIDALDKTSMVSPSLGSFKVPDLNFGLDSRLSGMQAKTSMDSQHTTNIQGANQYDTLGKSNAGDDYSFKSGDTLASLPATYPYAVAKLMADDLHYRNRQKRNQGNTRRKRSLDEPADYNGFEDVSNYGNDILAKNDNATLAHVYDPTRIVVPLVKQRPKAPIYRQYVNQQYLNQQRLNQQRFNQQRFNQQHVVNQQNVNQQNVNQQYHHAQFDQQQQHHPRVNQHQSHAGHNQQKFLAEVNQTPIENFRASFNLSNLFDDIHKLRTTQKPQAVQEPVQQTVEPLRVAVQQTLKPLRVSVQQTVKPLRVSVKEAVTPKSIKITSPRVKPSGIRRFFAHFFNKLTTMNPNCVPITQSDNSTTEAPVTEPDSNSTLSPAQSSDSNPSPGPSSEANPSPGPSTESNPSPDSAPGPDSSPSSPTITIDNICDSPDVMKLNLSINAKVCGNPKTKEYYSNGSISLQPPYAGAIQDDDNRVYLKKVDLQEQTSGRPTNNKYKENLKRKSEGEQPQIEEIFDKEPIKSTKGRPANSRKVAHTIRHRMASRRTPPGTRSPNFDLMLSGQLSKEIASVVYEFADKDPELMKLRPVIKRHKKDFQIHEMNNYPSWNEDIKNNQHSQMCFPLPADLQEFYDEILKTAEDIKMRKKNLDEHMENQASPKISRRFLMLQERAEMLKKSREGSHH